jgi:hypothetical protein
MADEKPLQGQAIARREAARVWKQRRLLDFKECYFFAAPDRQRQLSSQTAPSTQTMLDAPELNTSFAFLLCADFVTEIVNTYLPEAQEWCERKAGEGVPDDVFDQVKDRVRADDKKIFAAIKASNLYAELPKAFNPDLAIAGAGLWIDRPKAHKPIEVLAVPLREIEINLGPNGEIDDRFIIRYTRNTYVRKLLGDAIWNKVEAETRKKIEDKPDGHTEICWGFWRKWEEDDECWQHTVLLHNDLVHDSEIKGEGSCPFLVMRFNPTSDWPWALGPLIQGLPDMRQFDELERQKIEAVERAVNPAITFPDDSFTSVEQGIEPGMAYPIRPGTEGAVKRMYDQPSIQPEIYQTEQMAHQLKKLFYVDHPEQTGDTPPTLGQWLDELARMQRRIGMAGYSFWREGPMRIFMRFKYLLEQAGTIAPISRDGRMISTQPYNPTQRAAEQQEIATAMQFANMMAQMFPEEWRLAVDGTITMEAFAEKMRVTGLIKFRDKKQVAAALAQIAQLVGARQHAGAPVPQGAGAPAAA